MYARSWTKRHEAEINQNKSHLSLLRSFVIFAASLSIRERVEEEAQVNGTSEWAHIWLQIDLECEYISQLSFRLSINLLLPFKYIFDVCAQDDFFSLSFLYWLLLLPSSQHSTSPLFHSHTAFESHRKFIFLILIYYHSMISCLSAFLFCVFKESLERVHLMYRKDRYEIWEDIRQRKRSSSEGRRQAICCCDENEFFIGTIFSLDFELRLMTFSCETKVQDYQKNQIDSARQKRSSSSQFTACLQRIQCYH